MRFQESKAKLLGYHPILAFFSSTFYIQMPNLLHCGHFRRQLGPTALRKTGAYRYTDRPSLPRRLKLDKVARIVTPEDRGLKKSAGLLRRVLQRREAQDVTVVDASEERLSLYPDAVRDRGIVELLQSPHDVQGTGLGLGVDGNSSMAMTDHWSGLVGGADYPIAFGNCVRWNNRHTEVVHRRGISVSMPGFSRYKDPEAISN